MGSEGLIATIEGELDAAGIARHTEELDPGRQLAPHGGYYYSWYRLVVPAGRRREALEIVRALESTETL